MVNQLGMLRGLLGYWQTPPLSWPAERAAIEWAVGIIEAVEAGVKCETLAPIPMRLNCPSCSALHIDEGEFATKPHHTHACQHCGMVWRPAIVHTVGVQFLPGFKNGAGDEPSNPLVHYYAVSGHLCGKVGRVTTIKDDVTCPKCLELLTAVAKAEDQL